MWAEQFALWILVLCNCHTKINYLTAAKSLMQLATQLGYKMEQYLKRKGWMGFSLCNLLQMKVRSYLV